MAETKWTPGPLAAIAVTLGSRQEGKFGPGSAHSAVVDRDGNATALTGAASDARSQANATLYAAAPGLYAALRTLIERVEYYAPAMARDGDLDDARAALAKARGES